MYQHAFISYFFIFCLEKTCWEKEFQIKNGLLPTIHWSSLSSFHQCLDHKERVNKELIHYLLIPCVLLWVEDLGVACNRQRLESKNYEDKEFWITFYF